MVWGILCWGGNLLVLGDIGWSQPKYCLIPPDYCMWDCLIQTIGKIHVEIDRIPSTTPGAEPPRDARDSGSARSHSTHLETSSSDRP